MTSKNVLNIECGFIISGQLRSVFAITTEMSDVVNNSTVHVHVDLRVATISSCIGCFPG